MKKLAIISTHPIQYYAPIFKLLEERQQLTIKVFYTWGISAMQKFDPGFGKTINWDLPLLAGYPYQWVQNTAAVPGSHHFKGIINPNLIEQITAWQPDALLVYGWAYQSHLKCMRYFKNKLPVYFRGDSTLLYPASGLRKQLKKLYLRWVYRHIDHAFYVGSHNKAYFKHYGLTEAQLSFAPHAVDNNRFACNATAEAEALRHSLNIGQQDTLLLYAGKFEPVKSVILLLRAFISLHRPNIHLLLVGNGKDETMLKQVAQQSELHNQIHFFDFQNQSVMPIIYQAADLFCLPSLTESWGLAVNEAMACSTAILVSDGVGCATDLVKPGQNGEIFKTQSLNSLTWHLALLLGKNKKELATMGRRSKQIITGWSFQTQVQAMETTILKYG